MTGWHLYVGTVELWGYVWSVRLHAALGVAAAALLAAHAAGLIATGAWRDYRPPRRALARAICADLVRYTVGIWRGEPLASGGTEGHRLNAVQRLLYTLLLLVVLPGIALSGLVLLAARAALQSGLGPWPEAFTAAIHATLALFASLFFLLHLYMASLAPKGRIGWRRTQAGALALGVFLGASGPAIAAEGEAERRQPPLPCFACHSGTPSSRRIVVDPRTGTRKDVTVELARMAEGEHGRLACPTCHSRGFERFPHRPAAERRFPACRDCHPRQPPAAGAAADRAYDFIGIEREHGTTRHAAAFRKLRGERDCEACHHPHTFRTSAALMAPARLRAEHDAPCLRCHEADARGVLAKPLQAGLVAAHAPIPAAERHLQSLRCLDCHASRGKPRPHDLLGGSAALGCVDCHRPQSALLAGLWRFVPESAASRYGFTHAGLLDAHRVMAATRFSVLDGLAVGGFAALVVAIAAHLGLRLVARLRRSVRR